MASGPPDSPHQWPHQVPTKETHVSAKRFPVEIGLALSSALGEEQREQIEQAGRRAIEALQRNHPSFDFRLLPLDVDEAPGLVIHQLDILLSELTRERLDLALFVTASPLRTRGEQTVAGVASNLLNVGAFTISDLARAAKPIGGRLVTCRFLRVISALLGVAEEFRETPNEEFSADDGQPFLRPEGHDRLEQELQAVADQRLEERPTHYSALGFVVRALWTARREVLRATARGRPWLFPIRSPKLMAATFSAGIVLFITAEAWELGAAQSWTRLILLAICCWLGTVAFLLSRPGMLVRQLPARTEQRVIARVAVCAGIALGMLMTFAVVVGAAAALGSWFYPPSIVEAWAGVPPGLSSVLKVSLMVAALGISVGALGASLDTPSSLKHAVVVSDEVPWEGHR